MKGGNFPPTHWGSHADKAIKIDTFVGITYEWKIYVVPFLWYYGNQVFLSRVAKNKIQVYKKREDAEWLIWQNELLSSLMFAMPYW